MLRKDLIEWLTARPMTVREISRQLGKSIRETEADLLHVLKSIKPKGYQATITPAECRKCGFQFERQKLTKPSKCPECKSTWISEPRLKIDLPENQEIN